MCVEFERDERLQHSVQETTTTTTTTTEMVEQANSRCLSTHTRMSYFVLVLQTHWKMTNVSRTKKELLHIIFFFGVRVCVSVSIMRRYIYTRHQRCIQFKKLKRKRIKMMKKKAKKKKNCIKCTVNG